MHERENFNNIATSMEFFSHDKEVSEFIFNYTNRSKKLFPQSALKSHADSIKNATVLSEVAFCMAKSEYYPNIEEDILLQWLKNEGISVSADVNFMFSDEEKDACLKQWKDYGCKETLNKIIVRPILKS